MAMEYKVVTDPAPEGLAGKLDELDSEGWEPVSITSHGSLYATLARRPKPRGEPSVH